MRPCAAAALVIAGNQRGGQLTLTTDVGKLPGLRGGRSGPELMEIMRKQAERFDVDFIDEDAPPSTSPPAVRGHAAGVTDHAGAVIIATGAGTTGSPLPNEQR